MEYRPGKPTLQHRSIMGKLIYSGHCARPDLAVAVSFLCRYMQTPKVTHLHAAKHTVRYLSGTADLRIAYQRTSVLTSFALLGIIVILTMLRTSKTADSLLSCVPAVGQASLLDLSKAGDYSLVHCGGRIHGLVGCIQGVLLDHPAIGTMCPSLFLSSCLTTMKDALLLAQNLVFH